VVLTAVLAFGVALSSGALPWRHALAGVLRPPDFAADIAAARLLAAGSDPYEADVQGVQARILGIPTQEGYPFFPHPLLVVVLTRPLAHLPFNSAWRRGGGEKIFPVLLGGYLLPRAPRGVAWALVVGTIVTVLPMTWIGASCPGCLHPGDV
jgi:hypothetical protein